jgi:hypothetical protein
MTSVPARVFLTFGAWLLGVAAATGGSLAAVSLIGQSIIGPQTQRLTVSAVNRALAADRDASPPQASQTPVTSPPARRHRRIAKAGPTPTRTTTQSAGTLLSSAGGSVLARCDATGAYLISWSPQQGYEADDVVRGPAARAAVLFLIGNRGVRLTVTCTGPVPSASVSPWGDDGGGGSDDPPGDH